MFRTDLLKIQALISGVRNLHILYFHILEIALYCSKITDLIFAILYSGNRFVSLLILITFTCYRFIFLWSICLHISILIHLQLIFCINFHLGIISTFCCFLRLTFCVLRSIFLFIPCILLYIFCSIYILIFRILTAFCIICCFFQLCILCSICRFCLLCILCFRLFFSCSYL